MRQSASGYKIGLGLKIIIFVSLVIALTSMTLSISFIKHESDAITENLRNKAQILARNLAYNCGYGIITEDRSILEGFTVSVMREADVIGVTIENADGIVIVSNDKKKEGSLLADDVYKKMMNGSRSHVKLVDSGNDKYYEVAQLVEFEKLSSLKNEEIGMLIGLKNETGEAAPAKTPGNFEDVLFIDEEENNTGKEELMQNKENLLGEMIMFQGETEKKSDRIAGSLHTVGIVRVAVSTRKLSSAIAGMTTKAVIQTFVLISISILAVAVLVGFVTKPIRNLLTGTKRIADGDLEYTVKVRARDEIGELADSFNNMTVHLKKNIDNMKNVNTFSQAIVQAVDMDRLLQIILDKTIAIIGAVSGTIFVYDENEDVFRAPKKYGGGMFSRDCSLIKLLFDSNGVTDLDEDLLRSIDMTGAQREFIASKSLIIAVPMMVKENVYGIVLLAGKKNRTPYFREEKELLMTLANNASIAVANARLNEKQLENELLALELELAHDIQFSLMPSKTPVMENFDIGHISIPAKEIGGDYYDFIRIDDENMGISIADVSGKGVPAALYMAITRSLLRSSAVDNLCTDKVLSRVNELLFEDMQGKNMFVSMFYCILNARESTLRYSNAGQVFPIYYSSRHDKCSYLESRKLPLGICKNNNYEEGVMKLADNDFLLFYTDGIVESMNVDRELFGFPRLIDVIKSNSLNSADDLVHNLLHEVNDFSKGTSQSDDLTIVSVKNARS